MHAQLCHMTLIVLDQQIQIRVHKGRHKGRQEAKFTLLACYTQFTLLACYAQFTLLACYTQFTLLACYTQFTLLACYMRTNKV